MAASDRKNLKKSEGYTNSDFRLQKSFGLFEVIESIRNKKVAILTPTFMQFSGIDRVAELQAEELSKSNKVTVFTLKSAIKPKGYDVVELGMPRSAFSQRIYRLFFFLNKSKINRAVSMLKDYDIAIAHFYPMTIIACYAKKRHGLKYIYYNHGLAYPELFSFFERIYIYLFKIFSSPSLKEADYCISISKFLRDELKKETGLNSEVIYNRIDAKRFHKGISGKNVRDKYHLGKDPVILYVGRLSPHKGVHLLISAFNIVIKKIPNAKLLIVGKPTFDAYFSQLKRKIKGNVIITGFVDDKDLPYYYAASDVYATASLWEGFNLTIAEANASGKPAVAFDIGAHKEVLKKGMLVKPNDVKGMADAIVKLIRN